jgi:lysine N6-hydroxylase
MNTTIYDFAGIGIGPFNLGLAALCEPIKNIKAIFFDQKKEFNWHGNMQIPGTRMQVSYLADLVTLADPTSRFSYLNYLKDSGGMFQFGINENNYLTRTEYNRYCQWVSRQLDSLQFSHTVTNVEEIQEGFRVECRNIKSNLIQNFIAQNLVVGTGDIPFVPNCTKDFLCASVLHSSNYLPYKSTILENRRITILGAGQSGAEIFYDLLSSIKDTRIELNWITGDDRFYAMEYSKLILEMTSPDYLHYFFSLDKEKKSQILKQQKTLYRGINESLLNSIYDLLYELSSENMLPKIRIMPSCRLKKMTTSSFKGYNLSFLQLEQEKKFHLETDVLILATGYQKAPPQILMHSNININTDSNGNLAVDKHYTVNPARNIYVQNAEMHTHGFNAPDLAMGPYRNSLIINSIAKESIYNTKFKRMFQDFGAFA